MPLQLRVAVGNAGVVEVGRGIGGHAEALHDGSGAAVVLDREGDDLAKAEFFEAVGQPCLGSFRDITLAPEFGRQPPADLNGAGGKERQMVGPGDTDKADALTDAATSAAAKP